MSSSFVFPYYGIAAVFFSVKFQFINWTFVVDPVFARLALINTSAGVYGDKDNVWGHFLPSINAATLAFALVASVSRAPAA